MALDKKSDANKKKKLKIIYIVSGVVLISVILFFIFGRNRIDIPEVAPENQNTTMEQNRELLLGGTSNNFVIYSYGGERNVKTFIDGITNEEGDNAEEGFEYALIRNPSFVGGLELVITNPLGNYYFAEDELGNKIPFSGGSPNSRNGYEEVSAISRELLREKNTATEYFSAYPDFLSAQALGLVPVSDTGEANNLLKSRYLLITNINSNVSVVTEIDHRNEEQGTLLVSDLTRKKLGLDNGSTGNFRVELIPKEGQSLGVVRTFIRQQPPVTEN
ncbi:hypothetical protein N9L18_00100 [Candidatus Pacebacteria bacterium]|nr:hypothetical protein [Candidatus Paceibacterota bacterium]